MEDHYHASLSHLGDTFVFNRGGRYEKIEDGQAVEEYIGGEFCGFVSSDVPQLAASKSIAGAVFSQAHNVAPLPERTDTVTVHVYRLRDEPDRDISEGSYDFSAVEEVRYDRPSENPVDGLHVTTVVLTEQVIEDVQLAYLPEDGRLIDDWAEAVKDGINTLIETGEYPEHLDATRPNDDEYESPFEEAYGATPKAAAAPMDD